MTSMSLTCSRIISRPPSLPIHQNHDPNNLHSLVAGALDGLDGGSAGCDHIFQNRNPVARLKVSFNPSNHAMILLGFSNTEGLNRVVHHFGYKGCGHGKWIGAKRQTACA